MMLKHQLINQRARATIFRVIGQQTLNDGLFDGRGVDVQFEHEEVFRFDDSLDHINCIQFISTHGKRDIHQRIDPDQIIGNLLVCDRIVQDFHLDGDESIKFLAARVVVVVKPFA